MDHTPNPRRAELRALSMELRPMVKAGIYANVNEALRDYYARECGRSDFKTFAEWRREGRPVKKGERGFPVWGTPRRMKAGEGMAGDLGAIAALNGITPEGPEFFPVAYLFHGGQVQPEETSGDLFAAPQPRATCAEEIARHFDPSGTMRAAGLLQVVRVGD